MIFNADTAETRAKIIKYFSSGIKAPFVHVQVSTLGGTERASVIIKISLDSKKKWANDIYQNSRYAMFNLGRDGILELFSKSYKIPVKMRKQKATSLPDAIARINKWIRSVK